MAQQGIIPHGAEEPANAMGRAATLTRQQKTAGAPTQLEPATVAQLLDAYRKQNLGTLLGVLTRRPGEFARQLGRLSRLFPQHVAAIAEAFASVGRTLPLDELVRLHNRSRCGGEAQPRQLTDASPHPGSGAQP